MSPYPPWLSAGDNAWQLIAATLVGLMSIPGIAVLYAGIVQRKWAVNTMLMAFTGFSLVLLVWVLWGFNMGFGYPLHLGPGVLGSFIGQPRTLLGDNTQQQAVIPLLSGLIPEFRFSQTTLAYFQFVFAAITPLLFLGSVVGRINFRVWLLFVPLWSTLAYSVNAFLLWGGGWWAQQGALDYSGGYVIHLAAGTSGFVAAAVIGPRLARDRQRAVPNNLPLAAVGAGVLWLGWNGFNGGDPYFAGADASTAVINTNLATATALLAWLIMDLSFGVDHKPNFLGSINGMITGLVAITPAAGYVNGLGALLIGLIASVLVWLSWNKLGKTKLFRRVDDALGVFHTHGVAGLCGGLLVGLFANPNIIVYPGSAGAPAVSYSGLFYGHPKQLLIQAGAALTVIVWDALITFLILRFLGLFMKLRAPNEVLETGDLAVHDEEAYPASTVITRPARLAPPGQATPTAPSPPEPAADRKAPG
ncbi:ammonium transporter [Saccharomonospora sp. NPDC046836]|uniref:ammonium transporter n=1 Tax=Saccharomonospora sp. NPDC046836 TaxID=3156921 RepID=UPI0033F9F163